MICWVKFFFFEILTSSTCATPFFQIAVLQIVSSCLAQMMDYCFSLCYLFFTSSIISSVPFLISFFLSLFVFLFSCSFILVLFYLEGSTEWNSSFNYPDEPCTLHASPSVDPYMIICAGESSLDSPQVFSCYCPDLWSEPF